MILNLKRYADEVSSFIKAAESFIAKESQARLRTILDDLELGRDNPPRFPWRTLKPIKTIESRSYDRRTGLKDPVFATISFDGAFTRVGNNKSPDWRIDEMVTHVKVFSASQHANPVLHVHIDKKNAGQLGPEVHLQVSEACTQRLGMPLGVPRVPFGFLMPTDCLDFVLSEFFSTPWSQAQTDAHDINRLRLAQIERAEAFADCVRDEWRKSPKRTPVSLLQDCSFDGNLRLN